MATLSIGEFKFVEAWPTGFIQVVQAPPILVQTVALASTSNICAPFNGNTNIVRLQTDTNCAVVFSAVGTTIATATNTTGIFVNAGVPEYFGVFPGLTLAVCTT